MPILNIQQRMREIGRIRTGVQVATGNQGKKRPSKLDTFRLTSESRELIDAAQAAYGGTVVQWDNPAGGKEWEVITTVDAIDVVVPPGQAVTQWYELWSGGGCQRRCDGETNVLDMTPCACPQDVERRLELAKEGQACKATTRLSVMLPALPDLGVWRLESHGYYAAVELAGAAEILRMATSAGMLIPARLRLEQREKKVPGKPTNKYAVPILEMVQTRMAAMALQAAGVDPSMQLGPGAAPRALGAGERSPARPAIPATTPPATSDFRGPAAPTTAQEPAEGANGNEVQPDPGTAAAAQRPASLTRDELLARLEAERISPDYAGQAARRLFSLEPGQQLTDVQRAELLDELLREPVAL